MIIKTISVFLLSLYGILSAFVYKFWLSNHQEKIYNLRSELLILFPTIILHTILMWFNPFYTGFINLNFIYTINLITWCMVITYWIGSFYYNLKGLQIIIFPFAIINIILFLLFNEPSNIIQINNTMNILHLSISIVSNCLFGIGACLSILAILLDNDLKQKRMSKLITFLPPLLSLEKLTFKAIIIGFCLLSISLFMEIFFSNYIFKKDFEWGYSFIFNMISWMLYFILIIGKIIYSWRGKKISWLIIMGFVSLIFTYIGGNVISNTIFS